MDHNPFAPPAAVLGEPEAYAAAAGTPFFAVSTLKLAVLSFCSLGLYELYWFYQNWEQVRARERTKIMPFIRAFFCVFYCYPLLKILRDYPSPAAAPRINAGVLAAGWILTALSYRLPGFFAMASLFSFVFLLPAQAAANRINESEAPGHDPNSRFGIWNWIVVVLGGSLAILSLLSPLITKG